MTSKQERSVANCKIRCIDEGDLLVVANLNVFCYLITFI